MSARTGVFSEGLRHTTSTRICARSASVSLLWSSALRSVRSIAAFPIPRSFSPNRRCLSALWPSTPILVNNPYFQRRPRICELNPDQNVSRPQVHPAQSHLVPPASRHQGSGGRDCFAGRHRSLHLRFPRKTPSRGGRFPAGVPADFRPPRKSQGSVTLSPSAPSASSGHATCIIRMDCRGLVRALPL